MPTQYVKRTAIVLPAIAKPHAAPIYVDSDDNILKMVPAGSGSTEVQIVDASSAQTLTNKTLTSPVITGGTQTSLDTVVVYTGDGAIATTSHTAILTKGSAAAMTLAANATNGVRITIAAGSSFAHVITGTNLFWAGETGGPFNKITLAAFEGSAATVVSYNSLWYVVSDQIAVVGD